MAIETKKADGVVEPVVTVKPEALSAFLDEFANSEGKRRTMQKEIESGMPADEFVEKHGSGDGQKRYMKARYEKLKG